MKPAECSSASGEPVKPDLARRAASTPACAVRPTCSGFVIVPKLATTPAASEAAMAMALRVSSTVSRLRRAHAAAAAIAPQIAVGWNRSEEHTSELQSLRHLVCRLLLEK